MPVPTIDIKYAQNAVQQLANDRAEQMSDLG